MISQVLGFYANAQAIKQIDSANMNEVVLESCEKEIILLESLQHSDRIIRLIDNEVNRAEERISSVRELGDIDLASPIEKNGLISAGPTRIFCS
jgi:hypothetical protein